VVPEVKRTYDRVKMEVPNSPSSKLSAPGMSPALDAVIFSKAELSPDTCTRGGMFEGGEKAEIKEVMGVELP
jgi:hypothetical protein